MPGDEDDKEAGGRGGCAAGISLDATLSALYSSSEPRPLLELVTTASNRLSSRSIDDWLGLMMLTAGEVPADDRPARECSVEGTAKNKNNTQGSSFTLKIPNTRPTIKTRVIYGKSHQACM